MSNYGSYCFRNIDSENPTIVPADGPSPGAASSSTTTPSRSDPQTSPSNSSETPLDPASAERNAIAEDLLRIFRLYCTTVNAGDYHLTLTPAGQELKTHISPLFKARWDGIPHPLNWKGLQGMWISWAKDDPDIRFQVRHGNCDVDLERGKATLYAEVAGKGGLLNLCGLVEVQWKRMKTDGRWVMVHYWGIRGIWEQGGLTG